MADVTKFTNKELSDEMVSNNLGLKGDAKTELDARMVAAGVDNKKGFDHPTQPPPNP